MPRPLLVADAPSLLYRAFFALPDSITDDDGHPVNALLGATNLLLFAIEEHNPRAVVCCFGAEAATYRKRLYAGYHAARPPMPEGLVGQWENAPRLWERCGFETETSKELEADDLLGAYAAAETRAGGRTLLLTGDRDMYQCAADDVTVLYLKSGTKGFEAMGPEQVEARYGIPPAAVPDFIALRGDPSDGIPGAPGIGEKTAADLLRRHGTLDAAIESADDEKPRIAASLRDHADALRDYREMATLQPIEVALPAGGGLDAESAAKAAHALGMHRLAQRLAGMH